MKIAVCDNENYFVENILERVKAHGIKDEYPNVYKGFENPEDLLKSFKTIEYDLVYLDVELDGKNGMDVAREIINIKCDCIIIFVSAYDDYINESYRVCAFQYLQKPLDDKMFIEELERAIYKYQKTKKVYEFQIYSGMKFIKCSKILYISTHYREYTIKLLNNEYKGNVKTVDEIKKDILHYDFYPINRSITINFMHVESFTPHDVTMINGETFSISRSKRNDFKLKYLNFVRMEEE